LIIQVEDARINIGGTKNFLKFGFLLCVIVP